MKGRKRINTEQKWIKGENPGISKKKKKNPRSVHVGFVVGKVALGQVFPRVLRFSPVNFIPPMFHYKQKRKRNIIITGLHNKPQGFTTKKKHTIC
jgi:hypothetical protein